ncbi:MAG TPA: DUF1850 domain-containing protein [Pelomicrobium sp.]|nr:DUF1850 domain-containing protein [Pelomicrobium sp.]
MIGICLAVDMTIRAALPISEFTLAWNHSVEKVLWEEDYRVERHGLVPLAARVRGSGAGMEPPPGSVLRDGAWHYRPSAEPLPRLVLTVSPHAADYRLCSGGRCKMLGKLARTRAGAIHLFPCPVAP